MRHTSQLFSDTDKQAVKDAISESRETQGKPNSYSTPALILCLVLFSAISQKSGAKQSNRLAELRRQMLEFQAAEAEENFSGWARKQRQLCWVHLEWGSLSRTH